MVLRRVSACALPRASAMASAKLANKTVNQSHSAIWVLNQRFGAASGCVADKENRDQRSTHFYDEHDRVFSQRDRVQLDERFAQGTPYDFRIEQGPGACQLPRQERAT